MIELKPCPFCGQIPDLIDCKEVQPRCDCSFMADNYIPGDWNTRPLEEKLQAENERLREALKIADHIIKPNISQTVTTDTTYIDQYRYARKALERG